jgi:sortase (surface protein transpeptidase)
VNWKGTDGPFAHIDQLKAGDRVDVEHDNGTVATFTVDRVETFPKDDYPSDQVYADTADPELRMITCGGSFDTAAHSYRDNVVVFAKLTT